jgi:hypothetical protein
MRGRLLLLAIVTFILVIGGSAPTLAVDRYEILWEEGGVAFAPFDDSTYVEPAVPYYTVPDGTGGSFLVWQYGNDIYAQHVDAAGTLLWGPGGKFLVSGVARSMRAISDGAGGIIITHYEGYWFEIVAHRFDANGDALWAPEGVTASAYPWIPSSMDYRLAPDGSGGAILAIWYYLAPYPIREDLYAQRVDASGSVLWGAYGVLINRTYGDDLPYYAPPHIGMPRIVSDGTGGAIFSYTEEFSETNRNSRIEVSRVNESGVLEWTSAIGTTDADALDPELISDGYGGAIVSWASVLGGVNRILSQRYDGTGLGLWASGGEEICSGTAEGRSNKLASDGAGGAIITWSDNRGADLDIYGQLIDSSGAQQWTADGEMICSALNDQLEPRIVSDGTGGAIISWQDLRSGVYEDIYAQRVSPAGIGQWSAGGEIVCDEVFDQTDHVMIEDGSGGAIMSWLDYRLIGSDYFEIYMQKVDGSGTAQWTANGKLIVTYYSNRQDNIDHVADGEGGAIAVWIETMGGLFAQRVDSLGLRRWTDEGITLCPGDWRQDHPRIIPTSAGGAVVTWQDGRNGYNDIFAQRIDASGAEQWTATGIGICTDAAEQQQPKIIPDGAGGAIICWQDYRGGNADIYAQRVDESGAALWAADGVAVCTYTSGQELPEILSDGSGGAIILWQDDRLGNKDIYAQRIDSDGERVWFAVDGEIVCVKDNDQSNFQAVADGAGGAIVTWQQPEYDIYAQMINASGTYAWGLAGTPVCSYSANQLLPRIASDGAGGAIIAWIDARYASYPYKSGDVFAQRISPDGTKLWAQDGVYLTDHCTNTVCDIVADDSGGAIVTWRGYTFNTNYVRAQHIDCDAGLLWPANWPDGGVVIKEGDANYPQIASDGAGGAVITWYGLYGDPGQSVYGQRIVDAEVSGEIGPILFVDCDANGLGDGSSWDDAFTELHEALDTALVYFLEVEEIWVAEGTYMPTGGTDRNATFLIPRPNLALYGGFDGTESELGERDPAENATVLSGNIGEQGTNTDNCYHVVTAQNTDTTTVLDGFTIRDGYGDDGYGGAGLRATYPITIHDLVVADNYCTAAGAGAYLAASGSLALSDLVFNGNVSFNYGGGLYVEDTEGSLDVTICRAYFSDNAGSNAGGVYLKGHIDGFLEMSFADVTFIGNEVSGTGGGLYSYRCERASIHDAVFSGNTADVGGGFYLHCHMIEMSHMEFVENSAEQGGGCYVGGDSLVVSDAEFIGNDAIWRGGAIYMASDHCLILNAQFSGNIASYEGGGIYTISCPDLSLYNCVFCGNSAVDEAGAAMYNWGSTCRLVNTSFSRNSGSDCIHNYNVSMDLINSIVWDNEVPTEHSIENDGTSPGDMVISYSLVEDCWIDQGAGQVEWNDAYGTDGGNNLDEDPFFLNSIGYDLRLLTGSPAIDAGDETVAGLPSTDILGNPRIVGETIDMGAYEGAVSGIVVTVTTDPPEFEVIVAGAVHDSPYTFASITGTEIEIGVTSPQSYKGDDYYFVGWSDGGDTTHVVTLPDTNVTYTATFTDEVTGAEDGPLPRANALYQNYPNPFNPNTTVRFSLREREAVSLAIYDVAGRLVRALIDDVMDAGPHDVTWDGRDKAGRTVSSGVYFYRLVTGGFAETRKMVLLR